jgi:uncharacterized protein DUF3883
MVRSDFNALVEKHNREFDSSFEDAAEQQRGAFLEAFPLSKLQTLTLNQYVIGKKSPTFCTYVEPKTRLWANILGATSLKFGIYYGKTKSDAARRYRFVEGKFGGTKAEAFKAVKGALLQLIDDGRSSRFERIDGNPLSQMFKAKILSLYFPDKYLNVCSKDHIIILADELDLDEGWTSERQHLLLEEKFSRARTREWSNPKFMTFLYNTYIRPANDPMHLKGSRKRKPPKLDIDDMLERRNKIGKTSEEYALKWERQRLRSVDSNLVKQIDDCRNRPTTGYDFSSFTDPGTVRYIEVKTAGRNWGDEGFRCFLSETEYEISKDPAFRDEYYFYLVYYKDNKPFDLLAVRATEFYQDCNFSPNGYVLAFNREPTDEA